MTTEVAIIGGGLSGLSCALYFEEHNINYKLFESSDRIGGRVHSYQRKNLTIDRGFQILLPSYKICKKLLDYDKLKLCYYPNGASLITRDGNEWFGKPFAYPKEYQIGTKLKPNLMDYFSLGKDVLLGFNNPINPSYQAKSYFNQFYSKKFFEKFLNPFFKGVFLNQDWTTNIVKFRYYLNCFFLEGAAVPENGMQEIPNQLFSKLNKKNIELNKEIDQVNENKIIIKNRTHSFKHVVIATDMSNYFKLTKKPEPENCWNYEYNYILAKKGPTSLPPLNLVSKPSIISHFNIPTKVSTKMAPENVNYMNVSTFNQYRPKEIENEIKNLTEENDWFFVWEDHIPKSTPKIQGNPDKQNDQISVCGDWTSYGSIEGAMLSGYKTGKKISKELNL